MGQIKQVGDMSLIVVQEAHNSLLLRTIELPLDEFWVSLDFWESL